MVIADGGMLIFHVFVDSGVDEVMIVGLDVEEEFAGIGVDYWGGALEECVEIDGAGGVGVCRMSLRELVRMASMSSELAKM